MTRAEFARYYKATQLNTDGYTDEELTAMNERVYAIVADRPGRIDDRHIDITVGIVADAFEAEFNKSRGQKGTRL